MSLRGRLVVRRATRALRVANAQRRRQLEREPADYRTEADCDDLDAVTAEMRDILSHQRLWGRPDQIPGFRRD